jgi:hypothetical protein
MYEDGNIEDGNIVSEGAPLVPNRGPSVDALHEQQQQRQPNSTANNTSGGFAKPINIPISRVAQVILNTKTLRSILAAATRAVAAKRPQRLVSRYAQCFTRCGNTSCGREAATTLRSILAAAAKRPLRSMSATLRDPANARRSAPGQVIRARRSRERTAR